MYKWRELLKKGPLGVEHWFHLVCFSELEEELELVKGELFADFSLEEQERFINSILTVMAPFLRHHLNLSEDKWTLNLKEGNSAPPREKGKRPFLMESELWVALDRRNYKLLKKFHEGCDTFSMALVLRSLLALALRLIVSLGRDGFLVWVEEWIKNYEKRDDPKFREAWKELEKHIKLSEAPNVKYISLYSAWYDQIHFYHPPPDQ